MAQRPFTSNVTSTRPVVDRTSSGQQARGVALLLAAIIIIFFVLPHLHGGKMPSFSRAGGYVVENVNLQSGKNFGGSVSWLVTGNVVNNTRRPTEAPELRVRLLRPDESVAAEGTVDLGGQALPAGAAVRFQLRLQTGPNEALRADVQPVD